MERNVIEKKEFANGIICIITLKLAIHLCNGWPYSTRTRNLLFYEDVLIGGGGIQVDGLTVHLEFAL